MDRKVFNPERIGMEFCPNCSGFGRKYGEVCSKCGGFGLVRKENVLKNSAIDRPGAIGVVGRDGVQDLFFK